MGGVVIVLSYVLVCWAIALLLRRHRSWVHDRIWMAMGLSHQPLARFLSLALPWVAFGAGAMGPAWSALAS